MPSISSGLPPIVTHTRMHGDGLRESIRGRYTDVSITIDSVEHQPKEYVELHELDKLQQLLLEKVHLYGAESWSLMTSLNNNIYSNKSGPQDMRCPICGGDCCCILVPLRQTSSMVTIKANSLISLR